MVHPIVHDGHQPNQIDFLPSWNWGIDTGCQQDDCASLENVQVKNSSHMRWQGSLCLT
jgi:hypothetical protein